MEEQLPVSPDGGILDIHVTAFLSAIDGLLTAGRSSAPTKVLTPMKSVVNAVSMIMDDIHAFEKRPQRDRADVDLNGLKSLRERAETTLSNLVAATKTHAMSSGLSPVSLLDAAASHVSVTITEIGKTICIRKASSAEQDQFNNSSGTYSPSVTATNGFSPALRSIDEAGSHVRKGSIAASSSSRFGDLRRRPPSEHSDSDNTNSPPPIFDQSTGGLISDDSAAIEDNWAELKVNLMKVAI
jgi:protein SPA2